MPEKMAEQQMQVVSWSCGAAANADDGRILGHKNQKRFSSPTFSFEIKNSNMLFKTNRIGGKGIMRINRRKNMCQHISTLIHRRI